MRCSNANSLSVRADILPLLVARNVPLAEHVDRVIGQYRQAGKGSVGGVVRIAAHGQDVHQQRQERGFHETGADYHFIDSVPAVTEHEPVWLDHHRNAGSGDGHDADMLGQRIDSWTKLLRLWGTSSRLEDQEDRRLPRGARDRSRRQALVDLLPAQPGGVDLPMEQALTELPDVHHNHDDGPDADRDVTTVEELGRVASRKPRSMVRNTATRPPARARDHAQARVATR